MKRKEAKKLARLKRMQQSHNDRNKRAQEAQQKQQKIELDVQKEEHRESLRKQKKNKQQEAKQRLAADKQAQRLQAAKLDDAKRRQQQQEIAKQQYEERDRPVFEGETSSDDSDEEYTAEEARLLKAAQRQAAKADRARERVANKRRYNGSMMMFTVLALLSYIVGVRASSTTQLTQGLLGMGVAVTSTFTAGGLGYVPTHQGAGTVYIDNKTIDLCYMAKYGKGPHTTPILRAADGGCTAHMSGEEHIWVGKRRTLHRRKEIFGFDAASKQGGSFATEIGTIRLPCMKRGKPSTTSVKNVLYVPAMGSTTLVSLGKLDDEGFQFTVSGGVTTCYDHHLRRQWEARKVDGLYRFQSAEDGMRDLGKSLLSIDEAHASWGHAGEQTIRQMGDFPGNMSA